jgi:hypothetical protein
MAINRMPESPPAADELRQLVEAAFAETKYPGDDRLVYDNSRDHLECNEVAAAFKGKHWKQISLETLRHHSAGIFFFTPEAYRFYLPAYLLAAALHYDEADTISDSVVFSLIPPSDAKDAQSYLHRVEGFTTTQRKAIKRFLEFLKQQHPQDDVLGDMDKALANI